MFKGAVKGIGGWLILLILTIGVLAPLAQFGNILQLLNTSPEVQSRFGENWPSMRAAFFAIIVTRIAICFFVAERLIYRKSASTPREAIIGIWIAFGLLNVLSILVGAIFSTFPFSFGGAVQRLGPSLLLSAIATVYLLKSKRVARIYGGPTVAPA